ncbi:hypothetical protein ACSF83_00205 [Lactobacillus johnsonii]|uniref:hypothetical protein n=1 Tax=Lactobacillus johnsonii TaxID=33959 RepID=UPI00272B00C4|nr:hypothetical protein [uncultured Lactobacillus sp.]
MKKFSKLTAQAAVAVSLLSVGAPTFTSAVQASSVESATKSSELSTKSTVLSSQPNSEKLASVIQKNVRVLQNYDNSVEMSVVKTPELEKALKENNMSYADLKEMVSQVNSYLKENKKEIATSLKYVYVNDTLRKNKNSGTCAKALRFIGFVHSGAYKAAAAMLGVTGPTAVLVPLLVGLLYQAGALFC